MAKRKLNYRFHNPNPVEVTADYILKVMIEANTEKVEKILRENMVQMEAMSVSNSGLCCILHITRQIITGPSIRNF